MSKLKSSQIEHDGTYLDSIIDQIEIDLGNSGYTHPATHDPSIIVENSDNRFVTDVQIAAWDAKAESDVATTSLNGLMHKDDKIKLDGIEYNANNYSHPASHGADIITEDADHRFVSDVEKAAWDAKADTDVATQTSDGLMSDTDKTKLDGIQGGANNYIHPVTHNADIINEDADHRFVSDVEKSAWNDKLDASQYTAADVLAKLLTVDANTSGLNATTLQGMPVGNATDDAGPFIPYIGSGAGVMEVGRYIDFHHTLNNGDDYNVRLETDGSTDGALFLHGSRIVTENRINSLIDSSGHVHATSDVTGLDTALLNKLETSLKGSVDGLAELDSNGKIPVDQIPSLAIVETFTVASEAAMLALSAQQGDVAVRSDLPGTFILSSNDPSVLGNWIELATPTDVVLSVNGKTGALTLTKSDLGLSNVTNESKATMFNEPNFTGTADFTGNIVMSKSAPVIHMQDTGEAGNKNYFIVNDGGNLTIRKDAIGTSPYPLKYVDANEEWYVHNHKIWHEGNDDELVKKTNGEANSISLHNYVYFRDYDDMPSAATGLKTYVRDGRWNINPNNDETNDLKIFIDGDQVVTQSMLNSEISGAEYTHPATHDVSMITGALAKAGGIMSGNLQFNGTNPKILMTDTSGGTAQPGIEMYETTEGTNGVKLVYRVNTNDFALVGVDGGTEYEGLVQVRTASVNGLKYRNKQVWHEDNDGAGSGLDADLLDGKHRVNGASWDTIRDRIAYINSGGLMEVGRYIDFHTTDSTADYDGRLNMEDADTLKLQGADLELDWALTVNRAIHAKGDAGIYFHGHSGDTVNERNFRIDVNTNKIRFQSLDENLDWVKNLIDMSHDGTLFQFNGHDVLHTGNANHYWRSGNQNVYNYTHNDANASFYANTINYNVNGDQAVTANRIKTAMRIATVSNATGGTTFPEHQVYGQYVSVVDNGDSDNLRGIYAFTQSKVPTGDTCSKVYGGYFLSEAENEGGTVTDVFGIYSEGVADVRSGNVSNIYGGFFKSLTKSTNTDLTPSKFSGIRAEVEFVHDAGTMAPDRVYGVESIIDVNAQPVQPTGNSALFYGNYEGASFTGRYGVYIPGNYENSFGGALRSSNYVQAGKGSGSVGLTTNDGYGNANVTFNHYQGRPDISGNAARIAVNVDDSTNANLQIHLQSGVTAGQLTSISTNPEFFLSETEFRIHGKDVAFADDLSAAEYTHPATHDVSMITNAVRSNATHQKVETYFTIKAPASGDTNYAVLEFEDNAGNTKGHVYINDSGNYLALSPFNDAGERCDLVLHQDGNITWGGGRVFHETNSRNIAKGILHNTGTFGMGSETPAGNNGWASLGMATNNYGSLVMHYGGGSKELRFGLYDNNFGAWQSNPMTLYADTGNLTIIGDISAANIKVTGSNAELQNMIAKRDGSGNLEVATRINFANDDYINYNDSTNTFSVGTDGSEYDLLHKGNISFLAETKAADATYLNHHTASKSGFFTANTSAASGIGLESTWHHVINMHHFDNNGYGGQLAVPFYNSWNPIKRRSANGQTWNDWENIHQGPPVGQVTVSSSGWQASGSNVWNYYKTVSLAGVRAEDWIDIVPDNEKMDVIKAAEISPKVQTVNDAITLWSMNIPTEDFVVDYKITRG